MAEPSDHEVTKLLAAVRGGDNQAFERLYPMVYDELRRAARRQLAGERMGHTLDTAGLVNEAYLCSSTRRIRLPKAASTSSGSPRAPCVKCSSTTRASAVRRNAAASGCALPLSKQLGAALPAEEILALDSALEKLGAVDERLRQIVEYRFFAGPIRENEIADLLGDDADRPTRLG
ncbi:MAG: ECF-type sigma factor [Bryobacterales bacterium]